MYHSLIISGKNTFTEWGLVPTSRPVVNPPEVKTNYIDLPSSHGQLDYTTYLLAETPYGQRTGAWEFVVRPGHSWASVYSSLMNYLHGVKHRVVLEDDDRYMYIGRLSVNQWKSDRNYSLITIDYNLDPFKYTITASNDTEWLWDEMFTYPIRYGTFTVSGTKHRNLVNDGTMPAIPTFDCSAQMTVEFGDYTCTLMKGLNYNANLALQPGDNYMVFRGHGTVNVSYREASL